MPDKAARDKVIATAADQVRSDTTGFLTRARPESSGDNPDLIHLPTLIRHEFDVSSSEARRVICQGGVRVDGELVTDLDVPASSLAHRTLTYGNRRSVEL